MARPSKARMQAAKILGVDPTDLSEEDAKIALKKLMIPKDQFRIRQALRDTRNKNDKLA